MSDSKGKGRVMSNATEEIAQTNISTASPLSSGPPSLLSRIADSAQGLTRTAFSSSSNDVNNTLASATSSSEKTQAARNSGLQSRGEGSSAFFSPSSRVFNAGETQNFRTSHQEEHVKQTEADFSDFLDGIDSLKPSNEIDATSATQTFESVWSKSQAAQNQVAPRAVPEQEARDGEDVLAILLATTTTEVDPFDTTLDEEDENHDWGLSDEQLAQLRAMTRDLLPPPDPHGTISADAPLNLIPQSTAVNGLQLMGYSEIDAMEQWREQWEGVLTRYTDEVWGGLLPLVKEARQEVEDMKEGSVEEAPPKALRRLQAILGHLQKR